MLMKLKTLKEFEVLFPESTPLLEFSEILGFYQFGLKHLNLRSLKLQAPRVNTQVKKQEEGKFNEIRLK